MWTNPAVTQKPETFKSEVRSTLDINFRDKESEQNWIVIGFYKITEIINEIHDNSYITEVTSIFIELRTKIEINANFICKYANENKIDLCGTFIS